jgi:pilus assembly protein TadC
MKKNILKKEKVLSTDKLQEKITHLESEPLNFQKKTSFFSKFMHSKKIDNTSESNNKISDKLKEQEDSIKLNEEIKTENVVKGMSNKESMSKTQEIKNSNTPKIGDSIEVKSSKTKEIDKKENNIKSKDDKKSKPDPKDNFLPTFQQSAFSKIKQDYKIKNPFIKKKIIKEKISKYTRLKNLKSYLEKAGFTITDETKISRIISRIAIIFNILLTLFIFYTGYFRGDTFIILFPTLLALWTIVLFLIRMLLWMIFYFVVDLKIFKRRLALEEVLPDFLMLTSSNINAGMPIDQALWFAVRPRFGILAREIEEVAKTTLVGDDLKDALITFTKKYDSVVLKRSINLLLEGLESGGKIADIINKIAIDIQNTRTFKKEMAASVTTYVIFISFATVAAAPVLFALSNQLLGIIIKIMGGISTSSGSGPGMTFDASAISLSDFNIFAMATLTMTSVFSAMIISIIKKGNVKEGLSYIPSFVITSLIIYLVASKALGFFLGGMF